MNLFNKFPCGSVVIINQLYDLGPDWLLDIREELRQAQFSGEMGSWGTGTLLAVCLSMQGHFTRLTLLFTTTYQSLEEIWLAPRWDNVEEKTLQRRARCDSGVKEPQLKRKSLKNRSQPLSVPNKLSHKQNWYKLTLWSQHRKGT